ncbi:histidine phosphatase family protein [Lysinimonas soli]|uniref:Histidine phosphatase family protein n=1 Tax=Lysinimonas soli TaxID=1074233 RepID=A0ABW0NPZ3_9MICO
MRLLLIRHGQTPANVRGSLDTAAPGPSLTELGRTQAAAIPSALADEDIDGIYTSVLVRTQQTAAPLARVRGEMHRVVLPGIHEIEAGELEGRTDEAAVRRYLEVVWAWGSGELDARMPGAGDGHDFYGRFDADIARIAGEQAEDATVAAFSHGAAIRVWTAARASNIPPEFPGRNHLENTGVVALEGAPARGWIVTSWAGEPLGGLALEDPTARDVTGEPLTGP